jgi:hypothetical protein
VVELLVRVLRASWWGISVCEPDFSCGVDWWLIRFDAGTSAHWLFAGEMLE